jgi:DNA topoisomerase-1
MESMHHNGVMVPPEYEGQGLVVAIKDEKIKLNSEQEELAVAWAKKIGTPYVEDPVFAKNFHEDFSEKLGFKVLPGDVDYSEIRKLIIEERERKKNLPKEEKKRLREERKAIREMNKERYGYVTIDGIRMEIGNYVVEPSSIFMGRGKHPLRGKWKEGPRYEDIELNLSPDAPIPEGDWKEILWDPEAMWIARWRDKLSGKMKYVWPSDSSILKQKSDIEKFDKAKELQRDIDKVKSHIMENLDHEDLCRRKTATVCYLIDHLKFRIGDEKDEDEEADTVGASTLRPEHLTFNGGNKVVFDFLGKDSVRHYLEAELPEEVYGNLKHFAENAESTLFDEVNSKTVSDFLDEVITGLSAKVFRTCYSTKIVEEKLKKFEVSPDDPDYVKKHIATLANLEAAILCNHKRTIPRTWEKVLERRKERLKEKKRKARENLRKYREKIRDARNKYKERLARYEKKLAEDKEKLVEYKEILKQRMDEGRSTKGIKNRIASKKRVIKNGRQRIRDLKKKHRERIDRYKDRLEARRAKDQEYIEKYTLQIEARQMTRDYNLNTSLKSYIDPRIFYEWGRENDYDWKDYYSAALCRKFSWVEEGIPDHDS